MTTHTENSLDYLSSKYPPSLSVNQVAEITSTSADAVRNALSRGNYPIPSFKLGRRRLFRLVDVAAHLDVQFRATNSLANPQAEGPKRATSKPSDPSLRGRP